MNIKNSIKYSLLLLFIVSTLTTVIFGMNQTQITLPCNHTVVKKQFEDNIKHVVECNGYYSDKPLQEYITPFEYERLGILCPECGNPSAGFAVCGATKDMIDLYTKQFEVRCVIDVSPERIKHLMQIFEQYLTNKQIAKLLFRAHSNNILMTMIQWNNIVMVDYVLVLDQKYLSIDQMKKLLTVQNQKYGYNIFNVATTNKFYEIAQLLKTTAQKLFTPDELEFFLAERRSIRSETDQNDKQNLRPKKKRKNNIRCKHHRRNGKKTTKWARNRVKQFIERSM
jgi:hypothetical protein